MFAMVLVVTIFVIPKFSSFYESFQAQLPGITLFFIGAAKFLKENAILILVLISLAYLAVRLTETYRPRRHHRRPDQDPRPLHRPDHPRERHRGFPQDALAILVAGGIPVPESSVIAVETFSNRFYHSKIRASSPNISARATSCPTSWKGSPSSRASWWKWSAWGKPPAICRPCSTNAPTTTNDRSIPRSIR